jgi:hypothetical protein
MYPFHFYHDADALPELTEAQYQALIERLRYWVRAKEAHEPRLTEPQRQYLRQLDPDLSHSALLRRLLFQRKEPLPEPPPIKEGYPAYPPD